MGWADERRRDINRQTVDSDAVGGGEEKWLRNEEVRNSDMRKIEEAPRALLEVFT